MIKKLLIGLFALILILSCKKGSRSVPASTFSITFNGKTINDTSSVGNIVSVAVSVPTTCSHCSSIGITVTTHDLKCRLSGNNPGAVGLASSFFETSPVFLVDSLTDIAGGKVYSIQGGTIDIDMHNTNETRGTFSITLANDSTSYLATGTFDGWQ